MQLGDNSQITNQLLAEGQEGNFVLESYSATPATPLEYFILSWDQFVNELEFE